MVDGDGALGKQPIVGHIRDETHVFQLGIGKRVQSPPEPLLAFGLLRFGVALAWCFTRSLACCLHLALLALQWRWRRELALRRVFEAGGADETAQPEKKTSGCGENHTNHTTRRTQIQRQKQRQHGQKHTKAKTERSQREDSPSEFESENGLR